jgi:hypothetical protein
VLAVVRDRPGVTARELAVASGASGGTLYALLRRLTDSGELEKRELPGGQTGYAIGGEAGSGSATAQASAGAHRDGMPDTPRTAEGRVKPASDGSSARTAQPAADG